MRAYDLLGNIAIVKFPRKFNQKQKKKFASQLLKEQKTVKTVLEKSGRVKGRLRTHSTRFIAGEKTKEVLYRENGCVFRFDVDKTYFSPRLSNERKEIAKLIKKRDEVLVMFAGVGPFSIVIAKNSKAKKVYSNEINRTANNYAKMNVELNKLKNKIVFLDGDIKRITKRIASFSHPPTQRRNFNDNSTLKNYINKFKNISSERSERDNMLNIPRYFDVIVMPRPQLKESFLKEAFILSKKGTRIFYYDFCEVGNEDKIFEKIKNMASKIKKKIKILKFKHAGEIAPYKFRVRVDFRIV